MDLHLNNKVILVTGGAKGIGEAIVRLLVEEGAMAVIVDKDETAGISLTGQFKNQTAFYSCALHLADACKQVVAEVVKRFGRIDGLVNNAGSNDKVGLETGGPEKFTESLINNSGHYYSMAHYALPQLKENRGSIVNIGSKTALTGQGGTSGYAGAKGAILAMTRDWAIELLPFGIRVNAIIPAEVWTPMYESWVNTFKNPKEKLESIVKQIPLEKRMTTPQEIANMAVFLLSDRSSHTTGQWVHVDGGYVHLDRSL